MADVKLIVTDLDGTLLGPATEFHLYPEFCDRILEHRRLHNTQWVVCTGRPLRSFTRFFYPLQMMGIMPEYVIVNHSQIYSVTKIGFLPHIVWNMWIGYLIWIHKLSLTEVMDEWQELVIRTVRRVRTKVKTKERLCIRFDNDEDSALAVNLISERIAEHSNLQLFKYHREIEVRPVPFTKGLAVSELARHIRIPPESIMAIGNGHNDISMFNRKIAGMTGCPANSEAEVMEAIHACGGHIASKAALEGVLEIMYAYETDTVSSLLPKDWEDPSRRAPRAAPKKKGDSKKGIFNVWLMAASTYAFLLVLAKFTSLPKFISFPVKWPYDKALALLEKLLARIL